jgi:succinyl-CoA synthetase alpha subunit
MIEYGTNVVGGVTQEVGTTFYRPVFNTVKDAAEQAELIIYYFCSTSFADELWKLQIELK